MVLANTDYTEQVTRLLWMLVSEMQKATLPPTQEARAQPQQSKCILSQHIQVC